MTDTDQRRQYLSFYVGGGEYALEILQVREIIPHGEVTRLPRVPDFVIGLINLRGAVVPIVELARRLGLPPAERTARSCVVVTELERAGERTRIGLLTDDVSEVLELGPDDIEPAPELGAPVSATFLRGIGKVGARFVLILDAEAVVGGAALRAAWEQLAGLDAGDLAGTEPDAPGADSDDAPAPRQP